MLKISYQSSSEALKKASAVIINNQREDILMSDTLNKKEVDQLMRPVSIRSKLDLSGFKFPNKDKQTRGSGEHEEGSRTSTTAICSLTTHPR